MTNDILNSSILLGLVGGVVFISGISLPSLLGKEMMLSLGFIETYSIQHGLIMGGWIWATLCSGTGIIAWVTDLVLQTMNVRLRTRSAKTDWSRYFWIGLWLIPFSLVASLGTWFFVKAAQGTNQAAQFRGQALITILIAIVALALSVIGSGWAADEATKRVK